MNRDYRKEGVLKMKRYIWIPRILTIAFIIFISLFALDSFGTSDPWYMEIVGFLIHLIPTYILLAILILFWNKPVYSGISYITLALVFTIFFNTYRNLYSFILISILPAFIGILFLIFKDNIQMRRKGDIR